MHAGHELDCPPSCVARHTDPGSEPKCRLSGPFQGAASLDGHVSANAGCTASSLLCGTCTYTPPRRTVVSELQNLRLLKTRANPSGSSTTRSTQGTGTQGKTRGHDPGPDIDPCRFLHRATKLAPLCGKQNVARFFIGN